MMRPALFVAFAVSITPFPRILRAEDQYVFRSEVSLVRVDAQVVDRNNRAITGLTAQDFVLREEGVPQQIKNFAQEDVPLDVLLLLDVSGSMQPHIQRITRASHQAFQVLRDNDRVALMVFDRAARLRMPFRASRADAERELDAVLSEETFDGGTDVTRGLMEAARYVQANGRKEARRAIVILTDDQSERASDPKGTLRALTRADAVLSLLLAPDALGSGRGISFPRRGGGGVGGPLGGIILGRRMPGPVITGPHTHSAGTPEVARESSGDTLRVDDASALETTLSRLRQRYALHFHLPEGAQPGAERTIEVALSDAAQRRYPGAEVHFRRTYMAPGAANEPIAVAQEDGLRRRDRRPSGESDSGGWRKTGEQPASVEPPPSAPSATASAPPQQSAPVQQTEGGWRRVDDGSTPGWRRVGDHSDPRTQ